jgi:hypothetical protein
VISGSVAEKKVFKPLATDWWPGYHRRENLGGDSNRLLSLLGGPFSLENESTYPNWRRNADEVTTGI